MRLLNTKTLRLEYFDNDIPDYAILSHRWGQEEVSFQTLTSGRCTNLKGWAKVALCCRLASSRNLSYAWVDTCCIDKTSSSELSESINSMYYWYENAKECYAYLADVNCEQIHTQTEKNQFVNSAWFQRGWTLQELIAPKRVLFYNSVWKNLGSRISLEHDITRATLIDGQVLQGKIHPSSCTVAQRLSWASRRTTSRIEDGAYSLLGLLGVSMPLLYGEREKAFQRLQEEFIKVSDDQTIFTWSDDQPTKPVLAPSPHCFAYCHEFQRMIPTNDTTEGFSMLQSGLKIQLQLIPWAMNVYLAPLRCILMKPGKDKEPDTYWRVCLLLRRTEHDSQYVRISMKGADLIMKAPDDLACMTRTLSYGRQGVVIRRSNTTVESMFYGYRFTFRHARMFSSRDLMPESPDVVCEHKWKNTDPVFQIRSGSSRLAGVFRLSGFSNSLFMFLGFDEKFQPLCLVTPHSPKGLLERTKDFNLLGRADAKTVLDDKWLGSKMEKMGGDGTMISFRGDRQNEATIECRGLQMRICFRPRYSTYLQQKAWCVDFEDLALSPRPITPGRFSPLPPVMGRRRIADDDDDATTVRVLSKEKYYLNTGRRVPECSREQP